MLKTKIKPRVFWGSSVIIGSLLLMALIAPQASGLAFGRAQAWVIENFGWFYVAVIAGLLFTVVVLALGPTGRLKLGPDDCEPDFPYVSWLAMLFAAGMGIGLMYFAVAEPIQHYANPPDAAPGSFLAAREGMVITFLHWGVHGWAVYATVGLTLAYFSFRQNLPLSLRSGLHPFLGRRIHGPIGDAVDVFAICGTLFGLATSLGFGVAQINSGLDYLVGLKSAPMTQVGLVAVIIAVAAVSALSGVGRGVRRLSELNLSLAVGLMLFVLFAGPTVFLLKALVQNFGLYLDHFFERTFILYAYEPRAWMADWTLFYWAWWISWSPFVGMFIARISRGRTVREFIIGVLLVPTAFSFLWMTVFGNTAIALDMGQAAGAISQAVQADLSTALFRFLEYFPAAGFTSALAVALVAVFFVTSADSGALVLDTLASGGDENTPPWQRLYWCAVLGLAASLLMLAGGLGALQAATLMAALPFAVILVALCAGLVRQMNADVGGHEIDTEAPPLAEQVKRLLAPARRRDIDRQFQQHGLPAIEAAAKALSDEGLDTAEVILHDDGGELVVSHPGWNDFRWRLRAFPRPLPAFSARNAAESGRAVEWRLIAQTGAGRRHDVTGFTRQQIETELLETLTKWRRA